MKKLNFGCGRSPLEGFVNVDGQQGPKIDYTFDFITFPYPFNDDTFDYILVDNVLEHLTGPTRVLQELHRISRNNAKVDIIVPYYNSFYAYADPTHVNYFNEISLQQALGISSYIVNKQKEVFWIESLQLVPQRYLRWLPFFILDILRRFLGNIITEIKVTAVVRK